MPALLSQPADGVERRHSGDEAWAVWKVGGRPYTVGVEEEVMLVDARVPAPVHSSDLVISRLPEELRRHVSAETHAGVLELKSGAHATVAGAVGELGGLRQALAAELRGSGLRVLAAGLHPFYPRALTRVSAGERYRGLAQSLGWLALREPTMALHVHVGVPDPEDAVRLLDGLRESVAVLIALAANSPLLEGESSGFASTRTAVFGAFPRTGAPRVFDSYSEYVKAIGRLVRPGAIPDASQVWWDVRLQPGLGTVEVRAMDTQTGLADTAALVALIQSLARRELSGSRRRARSAPEVVAENRFLAARDGLDAELIDSASEQLVPVRALLEPLLGECRVHAEALGCAGALARVRRLAEVNGAVRQRTLMSGRGAEGLVSALAGEFASSAGAVSVQEAGVNDL